MSKDEIMSCIGDYDGLVVRSGVQVDKVKVEGLGF